MSSDLYRLGRAGQMVSTPGIARQLQRESDAIAARAELVHRTDVAQAFLTSTSMQNLRRLLAETREALAGDPLGADMYADLLRAYARSARDRIEGFQ